ncbi:MAG: protein kinase, partial [Muribaculaceae bacterium]|nr:protein kinase [Muribaculaceae bacterium]
EYTAEHSAGIDFDDAVKLPGGGSTCDIYKTRWQRRDVFVKRLREKYRSMPIYLDALDKEFDIGVSLKHPSLPEYREFHRDYIVIDYIDGETLAAMIARRDPWLTKEKNILKLLRELVDVVDYLHRHNVVHCDIKPDNIMITANNRNLVLIDFDKCYTDALSDTSGHPARYGLTTDDKGSTAIDFHGIGQLIEKMKESVPGFSLSCYRQLVQTCYRPDINCEDLKEILDAAGTNSHTTKQPKRLVAMATAAVIAVAIIIVLGVRLFDNHDTRTATTTTEIEDMADKQAVKSQENPTPTPTAVEIQAHTTLPEVKSAPTPQPEENSSPKTQAEIHKDFMMRATYLDQRIKPSFDELQADLDRLLALKNDTTLTGEQLLSSIRSHGDKADECIIEAYETLKEMYPGISEQEGATIMSCSKAYTGYTRRATPQLREFGHEIERRYKAVGGTPPIMH